MSLNVPSPFHRELFNEHGKYLKLFLLTAYLLKFKLFSVLLILLV